MCFRFPIGAGVISVGIAERYMNAGNFFVLQNVSNNLGAGCVRPDGELADPIAVIVCVGISAKFLQQFLILATEIDDAIVTHVDSNRSVVQITIFAAEIIPDDYITPERSVGAKRRSKHLV